MSIPESGKLELAVNDVPSESGGLNNFIGAGIHVHAGHFAERQCRVICWAIVIGLGALQAWSHRFQVDHDGVNYLDIADNYASGAWGAAINAYWSPLYSWLLASGASLFRLSRSSEPVFLHLINFTSYLCAYRCFEFFSSQLLRARLGAGASASFSGHTWRLLGLGLFLYSSLYLTNHGGSTPDITLAVFVYLAMGLLLRIWSGHVSWSTFCCYGAALGFGYLAKTVMFLLAFVFLAVAAAVAFRKHRGALAFFSAPICFLLVAAPWIITLSLAKGHFTYGDSGRMAYARHVQPQAAPFAWGGQTATSEHLPHPPRSLGDSPPVIEFATPLSGTFPLWYDGSYWLEGEKIHFSLEGQLRVLRRSAINYLEILNNQRENLVLFLLLFFLQDSTFEYFRRLGQLWPILLPPLAALGLYALVLVEPRYVAPFLLVLWLSLYATIRPSVTNMMKFKIFVHRAVLATIMVTCVVLLRGAISDAYSILRASANEQARVAESLQNLGISNGRFVSLIGTSRDSFDWARLAGLRIIAIVPNENANQYWFGTSGTQERVNGYFAKTGAVAIITDNVPAGAVSSGWKRIGQTSYSIYPLPTKTP
jgi:hypothetical protein